MPKLNFYKATLNFLNGLDKRFKIILATIGLYNWASSLTSNYNQLYTVALGADPIELGSLNSISGFVSSIISAPIGWLIDKYGVKKMIVTGLILSAIVSVIYCCATNWLMLIPAVILAPISFKMVIPLADLIFIGTSKPESRAQSMGLSRMIWAIPTLLAPTMSAIIITSYGGMNVQGIRPLYLIQLLSIILIIVFLIFMFEELHTKTATDKNKSNIFSVDFIESFRDLFVGEKWLKEWTILMSLSRFGTSISMPFIALWMVYSKGADPYILGAVSTAGIITSALLQVPVGILADRIGRKKVFFLVRPLTYLGTILLVFAPNPQSLILVGILGALGFVGGFGDISFIPFITMFWEAVPAEKRGRWFGLTGIFDILTVPAFLLGGLLWQVGFEELVLLLPLLIELLIMIPIMIRIPDQKA